jgi:type IV secretory pathway VirB3-like protein
MLLLQHNLLALIIVSPIVINVLPKITLVAQLAKLDLKKIVLELVLAPLHQILQLIQLHQHMLVSYLS